MAQGSRITFTERELELLDLVAEGHEAPAISRIMHISRSTVLIHRHRVRQKIGLKPGDSLRLWLKNNGWDVYWRDGKVWSPSCD